MWKCEGLFAESKQNHCLARAKYRGRPKVQIQAYLCAIVQNLKRLLFPLYCWLVAACLRFMHRAVHRQSANSTPPNSTHQMTAESILFQHAPWFYGTFCRQNGRGESDLSNGCVSGAPQTVPSNVCDFENRCAVQNRWFDGILNIRMRLSDATYWQVLPDWPAPTAIAKWPCQYPAKPWI